MKRMIFAAIAFAVVSCAGSCACSNPAHRNDPMCVIVKAVVDCTVDNVKAVSSQFEPVIMALIDAATGIDGTVDWSKVNWAGALVNLGVADGGCILAKMQQNYGTTTQLATASARAARQASSASAWLAAYRAQRWPGVRFKLPGGAEL